MRDERLGPHPPAELEGVGEVSLGVVVMAHQRGQHPEVVRRRADARERRRTDHDVASGVREQQVVQHGRVVEVVERHAGLGQHRGAGQPRDVAGQRRELVLGQLVEPNRSAPQMIHVFAQALRDDADPA